ncbi:MAG: bifunctional metallophosphatase/5'-nucleotidase [Bacillota bacterium]
MNKNLTILQVNDTHSYLEPHQELFWTANGAKYEIAGGYARIANLVQEIKRNKKRVLTIDCGDTIHGTYPAVKSEGGNIVSVLKKMPFDAMTAHWEFAYGPEKFIDFTNELNYPMLAINCYREGSDELVFDPYLIKDCAGLKIGMIGIAATIVDKVMPASFSEGLYFTLGDKELPIYINKLKQEEKVDVIVVLSHLGFPQELKLAREVEGIDVLLSGHTHNRVYRPAVVNDTIIIQSGCHGSFVGRLDLEITDKKVVDYQHSLIKISQDLDQDQGVKKIIDNIMQPYREELGQVLGYTETALNRNLVLEATMDNFLLKSILDLTGAEMAFSNGWRYGAPVVPGPITLNDLWNIIPVNPPISTCKLTGDELWQMMEENLERTFARDPYNQMGGYVKRSRGINLYFKIENPEGQRIEKLFVQGTEVDRDQVYDTAFVTTQGVPAKYGSERQKLDLKAIANLKRFLGEKKTISAELEGSIVAV